MDELDMLRGFRARLADVDEEARERVAMRVAASQRPAPAPPQRRRAALVAVMLAGLLVVAAISGAASGALSLVGVDDDTSTSMPTAGGGAPAAYLLGNELHDSLGAVHRLSVAASPSSGLTDALTSMSGQVVYEAAAQTQHPSLRLFDPSTNSDTLIAQDAEAPAWRSDGALAYTTPLQTAQEADSAVVMVRNSPTGAATAWSAPGHYRPLAWAGDTLIVARFGAGDVATLLAFSSPNVSRELVPGALVAISPDGTELLVADGASLDGIPSSPNLRLIDLATGDVKATLNLATAAPSWLAAGIVSPGGPGDWRDDQIIFPAPAGLVVLTASGGQLEVSHVVRFTGDSVLRGAEYHEARFAGPTDDHVVVKAIVVPTGGGTMLPSAVACDLTTNQCTRGAVATNPIEPLTLLYNESRPTN
jgi:hypothetical protein